MRVSFRRRSLDAVLRVLVGAACVIGGAGHAVAQRGVVCWGPTVFNSEWRHGPYTALMSRADFTVALRPNGTAVAWGNDDQHHCLVPALPAGLTYTKIATGPGHCIGLRSDGSWTSWGAGPLFATFLPPYNGSPLPPNVTYVQFAVSTHTVALLSDGTVLAAGPNTYGQTTVPLLPAGVTYTKVGAGSLYSAALRSDGQIVVWGTNQYGQWNVPALPLGITYVDFYAGMTHVLARRSDGVVVAWGANSVGQCNVPTAPAGQTYTQVAAGDGFSLALTSAGNVVAWGSNWAGQCNVPPPLPGLPYTFVEVGQSHSLALRSDGSVVAWGDNTSSACNAPELAAGDDFAAIEGGEGQFVALTFAGRAVGWGNNSFGEATPPSLPSGMKCAQVSCGKQYSLLLRSDGQVVGFGDNAHGQCAAPALPSGTKYTSAAASTGRHSLALRNDGAIVAFGSNTLGQCNVPALPAGLTYIAVSAGEVHSLGLRSDGTIVGWGDNSYGQRDFPPPPAGSSYVQIEASEAHSDARLSDGSTVHIGIAVGNGLPSSGVPYVDVASGIGHTLGLDAQGNVLLAGSLPGPNIGSWLLVAGQRVYDVSTGHFQPLAVTDGPCGVVATYCTAGTTSGGCVPAISGNGTPSASASSGFTIAVSSLEGLKQGILFYGTSNVGFTPTPWGQSSSYLCVKNPRQRTGVQNSGGTFAMCDGSLSLDWNSYRSSHPTALGNPFSAGQHVFAQGWFRDPPSPKTSNLSDALEFLLCP